MTAPMKWTYRQITDSTKESIRRSMFLALASSDHALRRLHAAYAYGAFCGWRTLVNGWTTEEDVAEMEHLTELDQYSEGAQEQSGSDR